MHDDFSALPVIDVARFDKLTAGKAGKQQVAAQIDAACRQSGFFYVVGHGVDADLQHDLQTVARHFFALPTAEKMQIEMSPGSTSSPRAARHLRVAGILSRRRRADFRPSRSKRGTVLRPGAAPGPLRPLTPNPSPAGGEGSRIDERVDGARGPNLFPEVPAGMRATVLQYMAALTELGQRLMAGVALGLGLPESYFAEHGTRDPLALFRIFNYPPPVPAVSLSNLPPGLDFGEPQSNWGVGEHTDYGLLTILLQDDVGGLEVKSKSGWVPAPPAARPPRSGQAPFAPPLHRTILNQPAPRLTFSSSPRMGLCGRRFDLHPHWQSGKMPLLRRCRAHSFVISATCSTA